MRKKHQKIQRKPDARAPGVAMEAPGCHPALTIEAERARCAAWNANATLAWQIRDRQKARES